MPSEFATYSMQPNRVCGKCLRPCARKAPKAPIPGWDVSEVGIRGGRQWTCLRQCISWSVLQALASWPRVSSCQACLLSERTRRRVRIWAAACRQCFVLALGAGAVRQPCARRAAGCRAGFRPARAAESRAIRGALERLCTAAADRRPRRCARPRKVVLVLPGPLAMAKGMGLCGRWHAGGSRVRCRGFGGGNVWQ